MPALTAVELNYFILRYLTESGFFHTAFMFECETSASKTPFDGNLIPPATLVELVQKGLQYMEKEEDLEKEENDEDKEFCSVQAMDLIEKVEYEEQKIESDEEKNQRMNRSAKSLRKGKLRKARERERLTERPWRKKQLTEMPWTKKKLAERPRRNEKLTELEDVLDIYRYERRKWRIPMEERVVDKNITSDVAGNSWGVKPSYITLNDLYNIVDVHKTSLFAVLCCTDLVQSLYLCVLCICPHFSAICCTI